MKTYKLKVKHPISTLPKNYYTKAPSIGKAIAKLHREDKLLSIVRVADNA